MAKAAVLLLIACAIAPAQQPLAFEVATIKPLQGYVNARGSLSGPRVTLSGYALEGLIMDAYQVDSWQLVGGPVWRDTDPFEIVAKAPGDAEPTPEQGRQMLQSLLADRFRLKVHREMRDAPVYALVVAKNGPKLTKSTAADSSYTVGREMKFQKQTMASLALRLSGSAHLGRPVLDKTGLAGEWDFTLTFMPNPPPDSNVPDVFTALQEQLGLKLESQRAPVEHLIIDHAEKPTPN
jgi:uncharacterized protein (TIGR03435 family)